jgi:hypothetical protein
VVIQVERTVVHPYRTPALVSVSPPPGDTGEAFRVALRAFLGVISVVRACLDLPNGSVTAGGLGALVVVCFAFRRG